MKTAASLKHRVALQEFIEGEGDEYGNPGVAEWTTRATVAAAYRHLQGGETVMSGRLAGTHTQIIRVRSSALARSVTPAWRVTDERGETYNVRDVTHTEDGRWVDLLAERGAVT